MADVKITVLQKLCMEELIAEYGAEGLGPCQKHQVGDVFISRGGRPPEGLCAEAWVAIGNYAFALAHGAENIWESWVKPGTVTINSCNDGLRPVIFKLEAMG